jgi:hypothetical protein
MTAVTLATISPVTMMDKLKKESEGDSKSRTSRSTNTVPEHSCTRNALPVLPLVILKCRASPLRGDDGMTFTKVFTGEFSLTKNTWLDTVGGRRILFTMMSRVAV